MFLQSWREEAWRLESIRGPQQQQVSSVSKMQALNLMCLPGSEEFYFAVTFDKSETSRVVSKCL